MPKEGFVHELAPGILRELAVQTRKRRYNHDVKLWAWDMLAVELWSKQVEIAETVRDHSRVAVAAGHGVGKSFVAAVISLWWWDTHPPMEEETFVATTAPSKDQVDLIWAKIRTLHAMMRIRYDKGLIDHYLPGYITGDNKYKLPDGQMLGQGRKPPDSKSDIAFQGRHATYLLAIGDEAVGLTAGFLNALEVIAVGEENKVLLLCNPTDPSCAMARLWPDPEGRGGNPDWKLIHISVLESPLITGEDGFDTTKVTGMSGKKFLKNAKEMYGGEDDPRYIARVLGQWAWDNGLGLFPEEVIAKAMRTHVVPHRDNPKSRFGVDVSRMGVDSTVVYECQEGYVWESDPETDELVENTNKIGLHIRMVDEWRRKPITSFDIEKPGTAQLIDRLALEFNTGAVNIDAGGGLGGGLFDAIHDVWRMDPRDQSYLLYEVDGSTPKGIDRRAFINLRAFGFSELKRRMANGEVDISTEDDKLLDELRGVRAKVVNGSALQIESKEDMKNRGAKSPDHADAVWYSTLDTEELIRQGQPGDVVALDPRELIMEEIGGFYGASEFGW